mmetsp:Transcript_23655/g.55650  ORF Transcript_23655/g.55650 Transcript_23655/m.55650 type:complete len:285 (+) Transcript_23655:61-915(+)
MIAPASLLCKFILNLFRDNQIQSIGVASEAAGNRPQIRLQLLIARGDGGRPQHLHSVSHGRYAGHSLPLDLESRAGQEGVLKVHDDILLILVLAVPHFRVGYLEILVDVRTLLADALDESVLEEGFGLLGDVGDGAGVLVDKKSGRVALGILTGLDGTVLTVHVLGGEGDDPVEGVGEVDKERTAVAALAPYFEEGAEATGYLIHGRESIAAQPRIDLLQTAAKGVGWLNGCAEDVAGDDASTDDRGGNLGKEVTTLGVKGRAAALGTSCLAAGDNKCIGAGGQ